MTTNVYLAWPFGFLSICLHLLVLVIDWSSSVANRFYHSSLLLWIVGNFIWMTVEFMGTPQSSSIHLGPETPLGGMSDATGDKLTNLKSKLFLIAIFLQLTLFACIKYDLILMPNDSDSELGDREDVLWEEDDEEMLSRLEEMFYLRQELSSQGEPPASLLEDKPDDAATTSTDNQHEKRAVNNGTREEPGASNMSSVSSSRQAEGSRGRDSAGPAPRPGAVSRNVSDSSIDDSVLDSFRRFIPTTKKYPLGFSLTFIENGYIILWICKDYFWSWATGDFHINRNAGYVTEFVSMFFGVLSVCLYTFVAYAWRGHFVNLMDSLTSWCWLFSNFTWMAGEIFIRYDSMRLNDDNQGDDGLTRLLSGVFFVVGLNVQVCVLCHFVLEARRAPANDYFSTRRRRDSRTLDASSSGGGGQGEGRGEGQGEDPMNVNDKLPDKWSDIEINGGDEGAGGSRLPKLSLGFLPKVGSNSHKFVNIQSMEVER